MGALQGKICLITGSGRGIGKAIALRFAAEGAAVITNARTPSNAEATAGEIQENGGRAFPIPADVSKPREVSQMVARGIAQFGRIDVLVNNAGVAPFVDFLEITPEIWQEAIEVDLGGVFYCSQAVARHMVDRGGGGRIINITSISGERVTNPTLQVAYCAAKGGANMLTKALAVALAPFSITVNAILPGTIQTDANMQDLASPATRERILNHTPLNSFGECGDVASLACFLASNEASWMTGSLVVLDGGYLAV